MVATMKARRLYHQPSASAGRRMYTSRKLTGLNGEFSAWHKVLHETDTANLLLVG